MRNKKSFILFAIICFLVLNCSNLKKEYYADGKIKSIIRLNKNNQYNGDANFFYDNGKLEKIVKFKNDSVVYCKVYFATGQMMWESPYKNNLKNGEYLEYFQNGALKKCILFNNDKVMKYNEYDSLNNLILEYKKIDTNYIPKWNSNFIKLIDAEISTERFAKIQLNIPSIPASQLIPDIINTEFKVVDRAKGIWEVRKLKKGKPLYLGIRIQLNDSTFYSLHDSPPTVVRSVAH